MGKGIRKKIFIITAAVIIVLFIGLAAVKAGKGKQDAGMLVNMVEVVKQDIESHVQTTGEVLTVDKREITSDVTGRILEVTAEKGQPVTKDQVLVKLDASEINYQLQQAQIKLDIERDTLEQLKKRDKLDLEITASNTEIQYNEAKNNYEQTKILYNEGAASLNELNLAKNKLDQMANTFILAKKNLENADNASDITIQEKQLELSQLNLSKLQEELEKYSIKSPIDGTVVEKTIAEDGIVSPGTSVMTVMDTNQLEITANVSEYDVNKIKIGDSVKITGDAIEGQEYAGTIKYIAPTAVSITTGQGKETVVEIKVKVDDKSTALKPGFSASVDILTEVKKDALVVPYEVLFTRKDGKKIIFTMEDGKAKSHEVQTGIESDLVVEVIGKDIKEKDRVILNPTENLKDGDPVQENKVMENDKNKKPQ